MQEPKNLSPGTRPGAEPDAAELAAWLRSLGVTREQVERAFRASAVNAGRGARARGRPTGR
jgi:hypothetical protein